MKETQGMWVQSLVWEDPLEEPGGLQSRGSQSRTRLKRLSTHACIFLVQVRQAGEHRMALEPLSLQGGPLWLWYPSHLYVATLETWILNRLLLLTASRGLAFIFFVVENLFCWPSEKTVLDAAVLLVSVGGGELRIFLLCHLDLELYFSSVLFLCVLHMG